MRRTPTHCEDERLELLVFGDEDSEQYRRAAAHVESCHRCQRRLSGMTRAEDNIQELASVLKESHIDETGARRANTSNLDESRRDSDQLSSEHSSASKARPSLDFLSPPSHPEMLGRLGRYEIERVIGSGGMGIVLKAFDTELNRPVAVKVLARHLAHSGAARQRFARESRAAAAVVHEHVVAIHDVETDGDVPYLVMQYVAGESLQERVDRDGPLDAREVLRIGVQAAAGLAAAHEQGVIHRDVKPANILLESGVDRTLLTDFGLARTVDDASLTHTGVVAGTPHYMSPEQANGETTDQRTDLFSLGAVLYFMATGRPPFRAERAMAVLKRICHDRHRPVWEVNADVPDSLSDIIDRLLNKDADQRPADAMEVKRVLSDSLADIQQNPRRRRRRRRIRWRGPGPLAVIAGLTTVVALAALLVAAVSRFARDPAKVRPDNPSTEIGRAENAESRPAGHSIETIRQVSASEAEDFRQSLGQVDRLLREMEAGTADAAPPDSTGRAWDTEIDRIHDRLDEIGTQTSF